MYKNFKVSETVGNIEVDKMELQLWVMNTINGLIYNKVHFNYYINLVNNKLEFRTGVKQGIELVSLLEGTELEYIIGEIKENTTLQSIFNRYKYWLVACMVDSLDFYNIDIKQDEVMKLVELIRFAVNDIAYYYQDRKYNELEVAYAALV